MVSYSEGALKFLNYLRVVKNASEHTLRNYALDLEAFKLFFEEEILKLEPELRSKNPYQKHKLENSDEISMGFCDAERRQYRDADMAERGSEKDRESSLKIRACGFDTGSKKLILEFSEPPLTRFSIGDIDKRSIRTYLAALSAKSATKKTVLRRLSTLRSFYKYLIKERLIEHNPLDEIDSPKLEKKIPPSLTYDQVERLFEQPDTSCYLGFRDRCIMELFYSSGLRISELVGLNRQDFDERNFRLRVMGKGKKERIVPMTQTAAKWLKDYLNHPERHQDIDDHKAQIDEKAIFLNKWGKRLTARSVDRNFEEYLKTSGLVGKITPHTIRHTIATHWLEKGMDLKTIQVLLGHRSLATTTIYTQVSSRLKREVYQKAHPLELSENKEESSHS
jgi:integrase/recombinase XerC